MSNNHLYYVLRIFWTICCLTSWFLCSYQMRTTWYEWESRPVSVLLETDRMNWNTKFPAVTICQTGSEELTRNTNDPNMAAVLEEIAFFSGRTTFVKNYLSKLSNETIPECHQLYFQRKFSKNCTELLKHCRWNNRDFECCTTFSPLQTELGICYSSGTLHSGVRKNALEMTINASQRNGNLNLDVNASSAKVFIHSWEDVPNHNSADDLIIEVKSGINYWRYLKITATENQPDVEEESVEKRFCRYPHEMYGISSKTFRYYSPGVCLIDCREKRMLQICKCVPHTQPGANKTNTCNLSGLLCISSHYTSIYVLSSNSSKDKEMFNQCSCDYSCNHLDIEVIDHFDTARNDNNLAGVRIIVPNLPSEKFNRVVVKDRLDEVVAVSGLVSLFLGTSLMTALEFFMFVAVRAWTKSHIIYPYVE